MACLGIVSSNETVPDPATEAEKHAKLVSRRDCELALIVLSVEPSLLYLIGEPQYRVEVWNKHGLISFKRKHGLISLNSEGSSTFYE